MGVRTGDLCPPPDPDAKKRLGPTGTPIASLGKDVEFYLSKLVAWGSESSLLDLSTASGANDTSKVRKALEDLGRVGALEMDPKETHGAHVRLLPDWRRRVDERREIGGETTRARLQAAKHREQRQAYHADTRSLRSDRS